MLQYIQCRSLLEQIVSAFLCHCAVFNGLSNYLSTCAIDFPGEGMDEVLESGVKRVEDHQREVEYTLESCLNSLNSPSYSTSSSP